MKPDRPYIKNVPIRTLDYTEEFCMVCDRVMQFDIQTNECVLCGSNSPFGLWDDHTNEEWEDYYKNNKISAQYCVLKKCRVI